MTSTRTSLSHADRLRGHVHSTGLGPGHGPNANMFTVDRRRPTPTRAHGAAAPLTGRAEAILQPKPKQAEFFDSPAAWPASRHRRPGRDRRGHRRTSAAATTSAFIEDGDYVSYNPFNLEDITRDRLPRGLGRRGRQHRGAPRLADRPARRQTPVADDRRLADLDERLAAADQPARRARTRCSSCSRTRRERGRPAEPQLVRVRSARAPRSPRRPRSPPTADADRRAQAPLDVALQRARRPTPRARPLTYAVGLRRPRHDDRHLDAAGPDLHVRQRRAPTRRR